MKKIFTTNLLFLLFLNILIKPFWIFGIDRTIQNTVGASEYGLFYTLFNFSLLLNILLDFGITNFNNREISRHPQLLNKYLANIVGIKLTLSVIYTIITIALALGLGYRGRQFNLLLVLIFNQFLSSFILYLRSNVSGLQLFSLDSILSILDKFIMIIVCGLFLWVPLNNIHFTIELFAFSQTFAYLIAAVITLLIIIKHGGILGIKFDYPFIVNMLRKSYPYALLVLLMTIYGRIDSIVIERILPNGNEAAGIYAQAFRLLDAANMFPFLFASLLLPIFSKMIKNNLKLSSFVGFTTILLVVPVVAIALPTFAFRSHIMDLLYREHTQYSSEVLGILMGSFIFIAIGYIFGTLLTAQGNLKQLNIISAIAVVVSIIIQPILVSSFNLIGAAYGNIIVNCFVALLQLRLAIRNFDFHINKTYILRFILFILLSILITIGCYFFNGKSTIAFLASSFLIVIVSLLVRLINFKELVSYFKFDSSFE